MFLDTVNEKELDEGLQLSFIKGITSNPTLFLNEGGNRIKQIERILEKNSSILFVQIIGDTIKELDEDYNKINTINSSKTIGIKVPITFTGLLFIKKIKDENPKQLIIGTAVYSADQGILGALAGCDYIAPYVNRMENNNLNPNKAISQMRKFIDDRNLPTKIMGASFKNTNQVIDTLMAGAHTVTIPLEILKSLINKQLALSAIEVFNSHGKQLEELYD